MGYCLFSPRCHQRQRNRDLRDCHFKCLDEIYFVVVRLKVLEHYPCGIVHLLHYVLHLLSRLNLHFDLYFSSLRLGTVQTVVCRHGAVQWHRPCLRTDGLIGNQLLCCFLSQSSVYCPTSSVGTAPWVLADSGPRETCSKRHPTDSELVQQSSCACVYLSGVEYIMA